MRQELSVPLFPVSPGCDGHGHRGRRTPVPAAPLPRRAGATNPSLTHPAPLLLNCDFFPHFKIT